MHQRRKKGRCMFCSYLRCRRWHCKGHGGQDQECPKTHSWDQTLSSSGQRIWLWPSSSFSDGESLTSNQVAPMSFQQVAFSKHCSPSDWAQPCLQYFGNIPTVYQSDIIRAALRVPLKSVITMRGLETANYRAWLSIEPGSIHISEQYQGQRVDWESC